MHFFLLNYLILFTNLESIACTFLHQFVNLENCNVAGVETEYLLINQTHQSNKLNLIINHSPPFRPNSCQPIIFESFSRES